VGRQSCAGTVAAKLDAMLFAAASAALVRSEIIRRSSWADHSHDVNRQTIGVRHVGSDEINAGLLKSEQEKRVTTKPINLRDD
jgi:hypothetical protein